MTKHTLASVRKDMKEIVEAKGADYVYRRTDSDNYDMCAYRHGSHPGCIVGHWFKLHDIKVPNELNIGHGVLSFHEHEPFDITPKALEYLQVVQNIQDDQEPWGLAIEARRKP